MTHYLWLIIYDSSFITHNLWLIIYDSLFYKKIQKIDEYLDSEESHYVMWCNGKGLADLVELSQKHARKCKETAVPLLNGFKVSNLFMVSRDQRTENSIWKNTQGCTGTVKLTCPCGYYVRVNMSGGADEGEKFDDLGTFSYQIVESTTYSKYAMWLIAPSSQHHFENLISEPQSWIEQYQSSWCQQNVETNQYGWAKL